MIERPDPRREPIEWLRWAYAQFGSARCSGCTSCADKCAGAFGMWREEFVRMRVALQAAGRQPKGLAPDDEWSPCPMLDPASCLCTVYQARPLVCRAFGLVPWLPCPIGRVLPIDAELARAIFADYAARPRKTYWRWLEEG